MKANCLTCGEPLVFWDEARLVVCHRCGKEETANCACSQGHYVCDECHRKFGVDFAFRYCLNTASNNPVEIFDEIALSEFVYQNGPEHHAIVGAVLLAAYRNAGGDLDLERSLDELRIRSSSVPGGACGYWGTCGAAISAGQFYSIISGSTPMKREAWGRCQRLTSNILGRLADFGGPRCCKRGAYTAIVEAARFTEETIGISMALPAGIRCGFLGGNKECIRACCPYWESK